MSDLHRRGVQTNGLSQAWAGHDALARQIRRCDPGFPARLHHRGASPQEPIHPCGALRRPERCPLRALLGRAGRDRAPPSEAAVLEPQGPEAHHDPETIRRNAPSLYQQLEPDWQFRVKGKVQANKTTIQLREGSTYGTSFHARCAAGTARLRIQLGHAPDNDPVVWTSDVVTLDSTLTRYGLAYEHAAPSVRNVRFSFSFLDRHSEIILDQIELCGRRPG